MTVVVSVAGFATMLGACGGGGTPTVEKVVMPPPANFHTSTESDAVNAELGTSEFDDYIDQPGIADATHLKSAYQATYDSTLDPDSSILTVIAEFDSAKDADTFRDLATRKGPFRSSRGDTVLDPKVTTVPGIDGSVLIQPTQPTTTKTNGVVDRYYDYAAAAVKGKRVMFLDYLTRKKVGEKELVDLAKAQYARL